MSKRVPSYSSQTFIVIHFVHVHLIALQCGFTGDRQGGNALPPTLWQRNRRGPQDYCAGVGVVQRTVSIQS